MDLSAVLGKQFTVFVLSVKDIYKSQFSKRYFVSHSEVNQKYHGKILYWYQKVILLHSCPKTS